MTQHHIYITSVGLLSSIGDELESVGRALEGGNSGLRTVDTNEASVFGNLLTGVITDFRAGPYLKNRKNLKLMSRSVQLGMAAIKRCHDGVNSDTPIQPERFGFVVGAGNAIGQNKDLVNVLRQARKDNLFSPEQFGTLGMHAINPLWLLKGLSNNILGFASADYDARGFNQNYCNSGISGLQAIGEAFWALKEDRADRIFAGGSDAPNDVYHMAGFSRIKALSSASTPSKVYAFDDRRDGFALGEGAAFFSLEKRSASAPRLPNALARIMGFATMTSAKSPYEGQASALSSCIRASLKHAGLERHDLAGIIAHGNGSRRFDAVEADAIAEVFGGKCPPVTSNKPQFGHTIAASGPLSVCSALYAGKNHRLPPILNLDNQDELSRQLNLVSKNSVQLASQYLMVISAGIGGQLATLIMEVFD